MPVAAITVQGLSFRYDTKLVLDNITFSIDRGDYVGLVGPNGSGKSTLVRLVLGLEKPTAGTLSLFGQPAGQFFHGQNIT